MALTTYLTSVYDAWYSYKNSTTKMGNGSGARLQVGCTTSAGDTFQNRAGIAFSANFDLAYPGQPITIISATMRLKVKGSSGCFSKGGAAKFFVERVSDINYVISENANSDDCTVSTGGDVDDERWGGPATTTTNRATYEGNPSSGTVIEVDITDIFTDWWAARASQQYFCVVLKAANAALSGYDETDTARRIPFHSIQSDSNPIYGPGSGPDIVVTFSVDVPPDAPNPLTPSGGGQTGTTTRTFTGDYHPATGTSDSLYAVGIVVATSASVDGDGKLNSGVVYDSAQAFSYDSSTHVWTTTCTFTQTRGTTYYWQGTVYDLGGQSAFGPVLSYKVNRLPTGTKVRPT